MKIPRFTAEASVYKSSESYHTDAMQLAAERVSAGRGVGVVVPARIGPVADCACCIFLDKYKCCRDCVEAILN